MIDAMTAAPVTAPDAAEADPRPDRRIVVLGIGNLLWADEGFGVRCVEALQARWRFASNVSLVDGGTQGLYLLPLVHGAHRLIVFDAVDYGLAPGTLKVVEDDEVPKFLGAEKMSLHQTGFQEVLALSQLSGHDPEKLVLIGCQPAELADFGGSLSETVKASVEPALQLALHWLEAWGAEPAPCDGGAAPGEPVTATALALEAYESGRPASDDACRIGDARVLAKRRQAEAAQPER
jgi:hydrogenase maturation protease